MLSFRLSVSRGFTRPGWLSCLRSPTFRHMHNLWSVFHRTLRPMLFCVLWYYLSSVLPIWSNAPLVTGISNPMASPILFLRAPLMTRLRNGFLVIVAFFPGGLICFRICLIDSFIVVANDRECFCSFSRTWNCPFRVIVADWRANRPGHVP